MNERHTIAVGIVSLSLCLLWVNRFAQAEDGKPAAPPTEASTQPDTEKPDTEAKPNGAKTVENVHPTPELKKAKVIEPKGEFAPKAKSLPEQPSAKPADPPRGFRFTLDLKDGSHLVCRGSKGLSIPVKAEFGEMDIPLSMVRSIQFYDDQRSIKVGFHNEDRLTGVFRAEELEVETLLGKIKIPAHVIVHLETEQPLFRPDPITEIPATIRTKDADPVLLTQTDEEKGWEMVPSFLDGARIYSERLHPNNGTTRFTVVDGGVVYLACDFGYEGNSSGGWKAKALTKNEFERKGWKAVAEMTAGNGRTYTVLRKACGAGQSFELRCNKYSPPLVVLLHHARELTVAPPYDE